eukprot:4605224-Pleurochrysis_carterae.AAC.6
MSVLVRPFAREKQSNYSRISAQRAGLALNFVAVPSASSSFVPFGFLALTLLLQILLDNSQCVHRVAKRLASWAKLPARLDSRIPRSSRLHVSIMDRLFKALLDALKREYTRPIRVPRVPASEPEGLPGGRIVSI